MLNQVTCAQFRPMLERTSLLYLPDGSSLPIQVRSLRDSSVTLPGLRKAFSVLLESLGPTDFVDGLCHLPMPDGTCLEQVFVSREPAMGRDKERGYFCIVFN